MKINKKICIFLAAIFCSLPLITEANSGKISVARAFYELARKNDTQKIENLLQRGYSLESVDERGYNAICLSVIRQSHEAYKTLVKYGAKEYPTCLKKIPDGAYKRFFGILPKQTAVKSYTPDSPYLIGTAAIAAGAVAAAYIFRGDTDSGDDGDDGGDGGNPGKECPENSHLEGNKCVCNSGFGNYGDKSKCYATITYCSTQNRDKCEKCNDGYILANNVCYKRIDNCVSQTGDICKQCESGYGIHGGNGNKCYVDIPNCKVQNEDSCQECIPGYGTYGDDGLCYKTVENCAIQVQDMCKKCVDPYDTYGDPYKCYKENPCAAYPNSVPTEGGASCVCDSRRGYTGNPYEEGCSQTSGSGDYQEGEEDNEEWNNYNELYCNSHGKYDQELKLCLCYQGYSGKDCSGCAENYLNFNGMCFRDLECSIKGPHIIQENDACICDKGYITNYNDQGKMECIEQKSCELHHEQRGDKCVCKQGFDANCDKCLEGYKYYEDTDSCVYEPECEEEWTGIKCDVCPPQYKITIDADGEHCGLECADNRLEISQNPSCEQCAPGYEFSNIDNTCITTECTTGVEGYIKDEETGACRCDIENGWRMSAQGKCEKIGDPLIGMYKSNINNDIIKVENDGILRDVYGMKPVESIDEEGNITYYNSVYNTLSSSGYNEGKIEITNKNTGGNFVYGIYSESDIYNSAVINTKTCSGECKNSSVGSIKITDDNTSSTIYGMHNSTDNDIYNSFSYGTGEGDGITHNNAQGSIVISKSETSSGSITGMQGGGNLYNAYAYTTEGINTNVNAGGSIEIEHKGSGDAIGIKGTNGNGKINNALSFLDSAVSEAISEGTITVSGNSNVYGIYGNGTIANSETQFKKNYNDKSKEFSSTGTINATTSSEQGIVVGIYAKGTNGIKTSVYNSKGYNAIGNINISNTGGGNAIGIHSEAQTYIGEDENGEAKTFYNNTYNAFRSSEVYGGETSEGNINITLSGRRSSGTSTVQGITAVGNVFNAYANSGSDVTLKTLGNINIKDNSGTDSVDIQGIYSNGATIANAYGTGNNQNTTTESIGNIDITVGTKQGLSTISGIYSDDINPQGSKIYNAALVNDKSNVTGKISLKASGGIAPSAMYGIYARSKKQGDSSEDAQPKYIYNAYYNNSSDISEGNVSGTIEIMAKGATLMSQGNYYGMYIQEGTAYNAYSTNSAANVTGTIKVDAYGGANGGIIAGMYGVDAILDNSGKGSVIDVTSRGKANAYGMYGENTYMTNDAEINVTNTNKGNAYGMYINRGSATNGVNGVINVSGDGNNYGIYALSDGTESGKTTVINNGTINLNGEGVNTGIYASGATTTVSNNGTIRINGQDCVGGACNNDNAIVLVNGATFENNGLTTSNADMDFDRWGGNIVLGEGGQFEATGSMSGNLKVSSNTVTDTFDTTSIIENALSADDVSDLNLSSNSYLYNSAISENSEGKYDVVMDMKDFNDVTDEDKAQYLEQNYQNKNNSDLYNALKTTKTAQEYKQREADIFGTSTIPNMAQENLKVQRSLDKTMMSELFKEGEDIRKMVGADGMYIGRDDHGTLSGYDITSQSMYALYDKKMNNNYRLGLGMSFTHTNTDYNNDSSRKNFMVQGYVPLTYSNNGWTAVSMARLGFADGDYNRRSYQHTFEADTTEITYGWLNELRYKMNLGIVNLTPFVGLNAIGWYQDSIDEGDDSLALQIASSHIFSLESALGLYLDKDIEFSNENKLNVALGIGYYHEFADPYRGLDAQIQDTFGSYKLRDIENIDSRDRGIISAKVKYDYKNISVYGELLQYLEKEYPIKVDVGLKYNF